MVPASQIFLLFVCTFLTEILQTSGAALRKPEGKCPAFVQGVRCHSGPGDQCDSNSDCKWNEMCCFNGCHKLCMRVIEDPLIFPKPPYFEPFQPPVNPKIPFPDLPIVTKPPYIDPFHPPVKPKFPFPDYPYNRPPPFYPPQPDLPPIVLDPFDPSGYIADENPFPVFNGREDNFP